MASLLDMLRAIQKRQNASAGENGLGDLSELAGPDTDLTQILGRPPGYREGDVIPSQDNDLGGVHGLNRSFLETYANSTVPGTFDHRYAQMLEGGRYKSAPARSEFTPDTQLTPEQIKALGPYANTMTPSEFAELLRRYGISGLGSGASVQNLGMGAMPREISL